MALQMARRVQMAASATLKVPMTQTHASAATRRCAMMLQAKQQAQPPRLRAQYATAQIRLWREGGCVQSMRCKTEFPAQNRGGRTRPRLAHQQTTTSKQTSAKDHLQDGSHTTGLPYKDMGLQHRPQQQQQVPMAPWARCMAIQQVLITAATTTTATTAATTPTTTAAKMMASVTTRP